MLTHENIVADVSATLLQLAEHKPHKVTHTHLSMIGLIIAAILNSFWETISIISLLLVDNALLNVG